MFLLEYERENNYYRTFNYTVVIPLGSVYETPLICLTYISLEGMQRVKRWLEVTTGIAG